MNISWEDAQTFLVVSEARSFSAAARVLDVGQPTISRRIAALEERLGCQLFRRGKRGAELTEAGARLVPAAEQMARWAGEFDRLARGAEEAVAGTVRIAAPPGVSVEYLVPFAAIARERHPDLRLEVLSSVAHVDLSRGVADLAIRTRAPHEPELMSLYSLEVEVAVFAAPEYARTLPARPTLADIDWVTWAGPLAHVAPRPFLEKAIPGFRPVFASDDYLVQKRAVVAGLGATILGRNLVPFDEAAGLVEIDVGLTLPKGGFHLVCARSMQWVPRVRAIADLLIAELEARVR